MHSSSIHRNTGCIIQPPAPANTNAATDLQQKIEQPKQRSSHSLSSVGKRALKNVSKLFQKSKAPQQKAATPPTVKNVKPSQPTPNAKTAKDKAPVSQLSSNSLDDLDDTRQPVTRAGHSGASTCGTKAQDPDEPATLQSSRQSMMTRSNGGRFELKDEKLVRNSEPQGSIQLDAKGKPDFSTFNTPGLAPLLDSILATPRQTYLAHQSKDGVHGHQLLQANGHLLHLAQDDSSLALIRSR